MKSSGEEIPTTEVACVARKQHPGSLETQWPVVLRYLPAGGQEAAWTHGAITRWRAVASAEALLRLMRAYAGNDGSLRTTAAWARP